jgi:hypothetical protein
MLLSEKWLTNQAFTRHITDQTVPTEPQPTVGNVDRFSNYIRPSGFHSLDFTTIFFTEQES